MVSQALIFFIRLISSVFRALSWRACRFFPSCSEYSALAFKGYPFWKAFWLTAGRFGRCHPFCAGGYDPLPDKEIR